MVNYTISYAATETIEVNATAMSEGIATNFGITYEAPTGSTYSMEFVYSIYITGFYIDLEQYSEYALAIKASFETLYSGKDLHAIC